MEDAQREGERILYEASLRFDKLELEQARINGSNVSYSTASISKLQVNLTDEPVYSISPVPQSLPPKPLQPPAQPYPTKVGPSIAPLTTNVTRMTDILQPTTTTTIVNHNVINRNGVASDVDISSHNQSKNENGSSSSAYDTNKNHLASLINPADFENTTASPFDDALLRSIDDKQELTSVFQQAYLTQTFPNHN